MIESLPVLLTLMLSGFTLITGCGGFTVKQYRLGPDVVIYDDEHKVRLSELRRASTKRLSALEDTNMAEAITGMAQADAAYRAALGAVNTVTRMSLMDYLR